MFKDQLLLPQWETGPREEAEPCSLPVSLGTHWPGVFQSHGLSVGHWMLTQQVAITLPLTAARWPYRCLMRTDICAGAVPTVV